MRIWVLGSGSSGNCLVVEAEGERIVVDAGMGPARATERMRALGAELIAPRTPLGVLVTHDHGDHAAHALPLARALRAPPGARRFGIATDLGHATRDLRAFLAACDDVFVESNHCPRLLEMGPYPARLKRRVAGPLGHLANDQAAELAASLQGTRVRRVVLVHLSRTNNTPERALEVVAERARRLAIEALAHGAPRRFDVASEGAAEQTVPAAVGERWSAAAEQLAFAF